MAESIRARLVERAWKSFLDPGTLACDVDAADKVLRLAADSLREDLDAVLPRTLCELEPDRMVRFTGILRSVRGYQAPRSLVDAALGAFRDARAMVDDHASPSALQRAHALAALVLAVEGAARLAPEDLVWLGVRTEASVLYPALAEWCASHHPIPPEVVELVRALRARHEGSPILDRLAAWLAPSPERMRDLAVWEHAFRSMGEPDWRAAAGRWCLGVTDPERDASVLRQTLEQSPNTEVVKRAVEHHGEVALQALRSAHANETVPMLRVLYGTWLDAFGGPA